MSNKLYYRDKQLWQLTRNIAIVFLLVGIIFYAMFAVFPEPDYEYFKQDTIVIRSLIYIEGSRYSGSYYVIVSEHGIEFNVSGDYDSIELRTYAKVGAEADIKYYFGKLFRHNYLKELTIKGKTLVRYEDNRRSTMLIVAILAAGIELIGGGFLWLGITCRISSHYNKQKTLELKERARMEKNRR
ncbi:MAG: hypothetical protein VB061_05920 [Christensenella sp.]|nr:hypothetical protein [Christensenella sp.]